MSAPAYLEEPLTIEFRGEVAFVAYKGVEICCMSAATLRTSKRRVGAALAVHDAGHGVVAGPLRIVDGGAQH